MGRGKSKEEAETLLSPPEDVPDDGYVWPDNMYEEIMEMGDNSKLVYQFAEILDAARSSRKAGHTFKGLILDERNHVTTSEENDITLLRSYTPQEIKFVVENNMENLQAHGGSFSDEGTLRRLHEALDNMIKRGEEMVPPMERPIAVEEYDDRYQDEELVFGIGRDSVRKRITLVFRGTESNYGATCSNWVANLSIRKKKVPMPESLKAEMKQQNFKVHSGFFGYLFKDTADKTDEVDKSKYDQIMEALSPLIKKYPDHKIYVTGHSLGAALSTIAAFYLSLDPGVPKPVTCLNFASPRVGDHAFRKAVQTLEARKELRVVRMVNDNDSVAVAPTWFYKHVGFQVHLYRKKGPVFLYPNPHKMSIKMTWMNNLLKSLNIGYDHGMGEYLKRISTHKEILEKADLNKLYGDEDMVGFSLSKPKTYMA